MVPSAVMNEAIVFFTVLAFRALVQRTPKEKLPESFRYFTVLSNLFCAFTALLLLLCELFGAMPAWVATLKYMGTAAVTVTLVTVFVYLLPVTRSLRGLLDAWPELVMHLITPVLAILSFLGFEQEGGKVEISGASTLEGSFSGKLSGSASGASHLYYKGEASVDVKTSGASDVKKK